MANRFLLAHARKRGTRSRSQEAFLTSQKPKVLAIYRQELGIFEPIPRLSKRRAWLLINRIVADQQREGGRGNG
jgi:hypothetical protein